MPQAGRERGGFSRAPTHALRSPVPTSCIILSLLEVTLLEVTLAISQLG